MEKLDLKNQKILFELEGNSRMSDSEIAKRVGVSKQVARYRINQMKTKGIIKAFQTSPNLNRLGITIYGNVYFKLQNITPVKEKEIITHLVKEKEVAYLASIGGQYELSIVLVAKNLLEFTQKLNQITQSYPKHLNNRRVSLRILTKKFSKDYLLEKAPIHEKSISLQSEKLVPIKLKQIDRDILKIITHNSRTSLVEISRVIRHPITTIHSRIKKLISDEVISGFPLLLDLKKIGVQNYKMFLSLKDQSEKVENQLIKFCEMNPHITWFFKTISEWDYELRIEVNSQEKYQEIVKEIRNYFGNVIDNIETINIFEEHKEDFGVILN